MSELAASHKRWSFGWARRALDFHHDGLATRVSTRNQRGDE
jgi:hypothetical protein